MDSIIGLTGDGYTLIAADMTLARSIAIMKEDLDKVMVVDDYKLMAAAGAHGDRVAFTEYIQKNVNLYEYRNSVPLSTHAAANYTRGELAAFLRKSPYQVNLLLGGYDEDTDATLYYIDYLGSMHKVDKAAHGYAAYFALSVLDRYWEPDMELEKGLEVMYRTIDQVTKRFMINAPKFMIKIVDKDGARVLETYGGEDMEEDYSDKIAARNALIKEKNSKKQESSSSNSGSSNQDDSAQQDGMDVELS